MNKFRLCLLVIAYFGLWVNAFSQAELIAKSLSYPKNLPQADEVAAQVYFVNHFHAFQNYAIVDKNQAITVIINRASNGMTTTNTVERYINNAYHDNEIRAKDLVIFRSGRLRGTGMLITDYLMPEKSPTYSIWLPKLRRIRHFSKPAHEDTWSGSIFTFGDVYLRKPYHETHQLQGTETFTDCLRGMNISAQEMEPYLQNLPTPSCYPQGKTVYRLKSTTQFANWWYDYRISFIDTTTFADYRTDYYKDGKMIKFIDRDWRAPPGYQGHDPRALSWGYWYGKDLQNDLESWAIIPSQVVIFDDQSLDPNLWTEQTLRKIRR